MSVTIYYISLMKLWDDEKILDPIPVCPCGAGHQTADHGTRNRLIQFLMELHDIYDSILDQILLLDLMPSVANVYSMVLRVEK